MVTWTMSLKGGTVFKDQGKLSFDYLPEKMPHRERQMQRLFQLFRPLLEANVPSNAFLHGPVGTGKTHLSRRFCIELTRKSQEGGRALDHVLVNCRQRMGDDAVLLAILKSYDDRFPDRGFSISEKLNVLRTWLEKRKTNLVIVLDEVDALLKKSGSNLIYTFSRFGEEHAGGRGHVSLILISQKTEALDYLDKAALSTFRRTSAVEFGKYGRDELRDIIQIRADLAIHPGCVGGEVLDLISDVASEFGDARYAIEMLWNAGLLADEESSDEIAAEHVRGAKAAVHPTGMEERLKALDRSKAIVLLAVARKIRKKAYISTGAAEEAYALVCEEYGEKQRGHTQFWKYLRDLDALGLIDAKISGEGVVGKTTLISLPEIPAKMLEGMLADILSDKRSRVSK
jgi:cell division control protein 6